MIRMFLNQGELEEERLPLFGDEKGDLQQQVWVILVLVAIACIPLMLWIKPWCLRPSSHDMHRSNSSTGDRTYHKLNNDSSSGEYKPVIQNQSEYHHEEVDIDSILESKQVEDGHGGFGEIFIHQLIETIEFSLGTVSNTASYLRLWALSLAHSQLSEVFYEKLLKELALDNYNEVMTPIMLFVLFPVYFSFTVFVLLCMDSMECFLHTLRLHWVEFQNKFYKGEGYLFKPLSFENELEELQKGDSE